MDRHINGSMGKWTRRWRQRKDGKTHLDLLSDLIIFKGQSEFMALLDVKSRKPHPPPMKPHTEAALIHLRVVQYRARAGNMTGPAECWLMGKWVDG